MSDYRVTATVPLDLATTARAIGRAMDIDVGGADSFVEREGVLQAKTWTNKDFADMFLYMKDNPIGLYMCVLSDYETRWPELTPPTLAEIEDFCKNLTLEITEE